MNNRETILAGREEYKDSYKLVRREVMKKKKQFLEAKRPLTPKKMVEGPKQFKGETNALINKMIKDESYKNYIAQTNEDTITA